MGIYSTNNRLGGTQQVLTTTYKTIVALTAATASLRRAQVVDIMFGTDGTLSATDCAVVYDVSRQTGAGTSTVVTPVALNPADAACDTVANVNFTAEGTITATSSLLTIALNQRASSRWFALPGSEMIIPATNLAGLALRALSPTYVSTVLLEALSQDI
jgi:hypothetical protein